MTDMETPNEVWKFPLRIDDHIEVEMPAGARLLHVEVQAGIPCLWALVSPAAARETRLFRLAGTGVAISADEARLHVGTFQQAGGLLVWHLFDLGSRAS